MLNQINNLEELQAEKQRLRAQMKIVQEELSKSTRRTREDFTEFLENKLSLPRQIGQLFQGGARQAAETHAVGALSRVAGLSNWWSGIISVLGPMAINFFREQMRRRKEKQQASGNGETPAPKPKAKRRNPFKRKSGKSQTDTPES